MESFLSIVTSPLNIGSSSQKSPKRTDFIKGDEKEAVGEGREKIIDQMVELEETVMMKEMTYRDTVENMIKTESELKSCQELNKELSKRLAALEKKSESDSLEIFDLRSQRESYSIDQAKIKTLEAALSRKEEDYRNLSIRHDQKTKEWINSQNDTREKLREMEAELKKKDNSKEELEQKNRKISELEDTNLRNSKLMEDMEAVLKLKNSELQSCFHERQFAYEKLEQSEMLVKQLKHELEHLIPMSNDKDRNKKDEVTQSEKSLQNILANLTYLNSSMQKVSLGQEESINISKNLESKFQEKDSNFFKLIDSFNTKSEKLHDLFQSTISHLSSMTMEVEESKTLILKLASKVSSFETQIVALPSKIDHELSRKASEKSAFNSKSRTNTSVSEKSGKY
jgi:hypothetical protein